MTEQNQIENDPGRIIDASPTKRLFIEILTKDIPLKHAITDLVDNSLDGALRVREDKFYKGLEVRLEIERKKFRIIDNCGGIPVDVAREYAFRFGRSEDIEQPLLSTIGEFGVGMKRTLFKLGNIFSVKSIHKNSRFSMEVNVEKWENEEQDEWHFEFTDYKEHENNPEDECMTEIIVTELYPEISQAFGSDKFILQIREELEKAHVESIQRGLVITVNQIPARKKPLKLHFSKEIFPAYRRDIHRPGKEKEDVTVLIYVGIGKSNPDEAGWYIFCNGRVILNANQSIITGWGSGPGLPKYHNQYARFRGYVFMDADNPSLLPWNTTKTGIDEDSSLYKAVRLNMDTMMKSVISFLNDLDKEKTSYKDMDGDLGPIETAIVKADLLSVIEIRTQNLPKTFKPKVSILAPPPPEYGRISYLKPKKEINKIKKLLKVRSNKEVGEKTFEYFYDSEVQDDIS